MRVAEVKNKPNRNFLVPVHTNPLCSEIQDLMTNTFDQSLVGIGRDGMGLNHTGLQVCLFTYLH
jgi:hypothetical protein